MLLYLVCDWSYVNVVAVLRELTSSLCSARPRQCRSLGQTLIQEGRCREKAMALASELEVPHWGPECSGSRKSLQLGLRKCVISGSDEGHKARRISVSARPKVCMYVPMINTPCPVA